jgi:MOSC domain-containing protein YiiM
MAEGCLLSVNRSNGGLPKLKVRGPARLNSEGVEGDWQRNRKYHGGPNKAVLMIASEVLDALRAEDYPVFHGALGENLTVAGLDPHSWRPGQLYRIGDDAVIELTTLRTPCQNLFVFGAAEGRPIGPELYDARCKAGDSSSPHWAHGGFYARVIREGWLVEGAAVVLESDLA